MIDEQSKGLSHSMWIAVLVMTLVAAAGLGWLAVIFHRRRWAAYHAARHEYEIDQYVRRLDAHMQERQEAELAQRTASPISLPPPATQPDRASIDIGAMPRPVAPLYQSSNTSQPPPYQATSSTANRDPA